MSPNHPLTTPRTPLTRTLRHFSLALVLSLMAGATSGCDQASAAEPEAQLEDRIAHLEAKEYLRTVTLKLARIIDEADLPGLEELEPIIHDDFVLDAIDFDGGVFSFAGFDQLVAGYGPIMVATQPNLAASAIDVQIDEDTATVYFKFTNSVQPPPQLGLDVDAKVLLIAANTATFVYEDGAWMLTGLVLEHSLAYPGVVPGH